MSTSLAAQLRNLAVPSTNALKNDNKRSTLLFDPKEAATISGEVIYEIGLEGLEQLIIKNDDFMHFKETLYHASSKEFDRSVQSKDENNKVNKTVKKFLVTLAPYFLTNPAHKALEWLFYRYSVNEFNKDDLILMALPYYNSNIFSRLVQTLTFNDFNEPFYFLKTVQKSGVHLQRLDLFYQALSNANIIKYITKFMDQLINIHRNYSVLTTQFNFYSTVFCGAIEFSNEISESFVTQMLPLVLKGLSSPIPDFAAASYVIMARLISKGALTAKLLNVFIEKVSELKCNSLKLEATLVVVLTYQLQKQYVEIPPKAFANFSTSDWIVNCLQYLHSNGNYIDDFLKLLVQKAVHQAVKENDPLSRELVVNIVEEIQFDGCFIKTFLCLILDVVNEKTMNITEINKWVSDIINKIGLKYPSDLDIAVAEIIKEQSTIPGRKSFLKTITGSVNESFSVKFQILDDLYDKEVMKPETLKSVAEFISNLKSSDQYFFTNVLCEKLQDSNYKIVERTIKLLNLTDIVKTSLLQSNLMELFRSKKLLNKEWEKSYILAASMLTKEQQFTWRIFICIFPFIALYHKKYFKDIKVLLKFPFFTQSKLFSKFNIDGCDNSDICFSKLLSCLDNCADRQLFDEFLNHVSVEAETNCISQYSAAIILSRISPDISLLNKASVNSFFKVFSICHKHHVSSEASTLQGYLELALRKIISLEGIIDCINAIIKKSTDTNLNWATIDFCNNSGYSYFLSGLCSLAFSERKLEYIFYSYLNNISSNVKIKIKVCLNICSSGLLNETIMFKLVSFTRRMLEDNTEKSVALDQFSCLCLLTLFSNSSAKIRKTVFELTDYLIKQCEIKSNYAWFLQQLSSYQEEIITDLEQMSLVCFNLLASSNTKTDTDLGKKQLFLSDLLGIVCSNGIPIYIKAGILKALSHINNFQMLESLCKHFLELFKDKHMSGEFQTTILTNLIRKFDLGVMAQISLSSYIWRFIVFILNCKEIVVIDSEKMFIPSYLLNHFPRDVYAVLSEDVLQKLLDQICEISVLSEEPEVVSISSKIFKHIDLNAKLISSLLSEMVEVQSNRTSSTKSRRVHGIPTVDILDTTAWKKGICTLEFIQGKKKIRNGQLLLPLLFDILKRCLDFEEQAAVEYSKQLTLSLILLVCSKLEEEVISEKDFNIELVIQCIRASQNPQTHYHALLTLAHAAKFVPNEVLHHVMAVFTFMGSTLIRHDDAYSFEIISKIVDTIVPILVGGSHTTAITDVLRVFVDALLDVPEHRRIPLYSKLLDNIKAKDNFHLFLLLILEAEVFQASREKRKIEKGVTSQRINIALELCQQFSPNITLHACVLLAKYLNDLPDEKDDMVMSHTKDCLITLTKYNAKQFRHYKYLIVTFLSSLLSSRGFVTNVAMLSDKSNVNMEHLFKELIINVLAYIQRIQRVCEKSANTPQSLYWKTVLYHSYDLLDSVNDLLTPHMFLLVIKGLLVHSLHTVKKRALELLNNKLQYNLSSFENQDQAELYILIKPIILIIETIQQDNLQSDQETLIQTALLSLKLIVKTLGSQEPEKFVPILDFVSSILKSGKAQNNVLASVILCLAELCIVLRGHGIAGLTSFMPAFLTILKNQKHQQASSMLLISVITTLNKLLDSFAAFLSPYLKKIVCETSIIISKWNCAGDDPKSQALVTRLNTIKKKLSTVIPPRILIPTIEECYNTLIDKRYNNALVALIDIMEEQLSNLQFPEIVANMSELTSFFLKALQFRCDNTSTLEVANLVEDQVVKTITVFILKLSESTFRPFYLKLYDWAIRAGSNRERLITFYHLSESVGQALKGLFVLFAGNILNNVSEMLKSINNTTSDNTVFDDNNKTILLLEYILRTLQVIFTYDNKKLINRDRFELLMQPLVDLLEKDIDGVDALVKRNKKLITPTIVHFSLAIADDSLWKEMNYQILLKMRNSNPEIRLVALHCLTEVVSKLKEDFLPLLPETIPFLAELLEDEDERVERSCQKTIREMEKVLGEPLQKYF